MEEITWHNERRKVDDLLPYEGNPRKLTEKQAEQLTQSLRKFGLAEIPAINTDNRIVAGHQRMRMLQLLGRGQEEVDVRVPSRTLTEEEFREYLIRSNKNSGEWDWDKLANEFAAEDLREYGFTNAELGISDVPEELAAEVDMPNLEAGLASECPKCGFKF